MKTLAEIVLDADLVSRDDIGRAATVADERGVPLVVVVVRDLGVDELSLVAAIRKQTRVRSIDPADARQDSDALRELSRDACRRLRVLPLALSVYGSGPRRLRLAMADPTDTVAKAEVEHLTGCEVDLALMPLSTVEELIERWYRAFVTEVMRRDRKPFGSGLEVATQPLPEPSSGERAHTPSTVPYHRVSDEAELALRHQALLDLLLDKEIIGEEEYEERVRQLLKRRQEGG